MIVYQPVTDIPIKYTCVIVQLRGIVLKRKKQLTYSAESSIIIRTKPTVKPNVGILL